MWYSKTTTIDKDSCLIYRGPCFIIEWFYDENGYSQPYEYFLKSSTGQKRKFLLLAKKMGDFGKIIDKIRYMLLNLSLTDIYVFSKQERRLLSQMLSEKRATNFLNKKKHWQ